MRKLLLSLLALSILGCNFQESAIKEQRKKWEYDKWKEHFKDRALCKCLLAGYGEKEIVDFIYKTDKSYYDAVAMAIFDPTIDSALTYEIFGMKSDSIQSYKTMSEAAVGKRVFSQCLNFYKSSELDAIAKAQSIKWDTITNIDSIVANKIPAF